METKLQIALCALLLINLGFTALGDDPTAPSTPSEGNLDLGKSLGSQPSSSSNIETAGSVPASGPASPSPAVALELDSSSTVSSSSSSTSNNTTRAAETTSVTPTIPHLNTPSTPNTQGDNEGNATGMDLPIIPPFPEKEGNLTDLSSPQPPLPPSENHTPSTSHMPSTSTSTSTTSTPPSPAHTAHSAPTQTPLTTSHHSTRPHAPPDSPSSSPTPSTRHPKTDSPTAAPTPEPHHTKPVSAIATSSTQPGSDSSTDSPQPIPDSHPTTLASPKATSESAPHPQTSSTARVQPVPTFIPPSSPHADGPSQLNTGGDATAVHESPTLDPLLAGLVSAFIITAVIITLLLFLKLRRRDNRPEFRRLQDLPMDDMMEDTPLSMYSY
ncbi:anti-sigma-I factor RsgI2 [Centroberyx affinis]|uniref:anti-sigma-I factor RsgI2 n=1 Tax=Centroberyx affinis TaxID=166261 RepID=UPI003A5C4DEC